MGNENLASRAVAPKRNGTLYQLNSAKTGNWQNKKVILEIKFKLAMVMTDERNLSDMLAYNHRKFL